MSQVLQKVLDIPATGMFIMQRMNNTLTIKQVAEEVGLSPKTIRYYESLNITQPAKRKGNKYRAYTNDDISRLRLIKQGRALGLPLKEIKPLVKHCIDGNCDNLKTDLVKKIPLYIVSVEQKIIELQLLRDQFNKLNVALTSNKPSECFGNCCPTIDELVKINNYE